MVDLDKLQGVLKTGLGFWRNLFFYLMAFTTTAILIWQLSLLEPPEKWCPQKRLDVCFATITKNLELRDHTIIGLMVVLAVVVIGSMVTTYKLSAKVEGSAGGVSVDIHQDKTTVTTPTAAINVPTVPTTPSNLDAEAPGE